MAGWKATNWSASNTIKSLFKVDSSEMTTETIKLQFFLFEEHKMNSEDSNHL